MGCAVGLVHVRVASEAAVRTCKSAGAVRASQSASAVGRVGGVGCTVGLVDVRVASQATVRARQSAGTVRASQAAVRVGQAAVGTSQAAGAVGGVGRVAGTVELVRVRVASQATVRTSQARVRTCNAAVRAGNSTVRASQASAVRVLGVRAVAFIADRETASGGDRITVLEVHARTADETASLNSVIVESVGLEAVVAIVGVGGRVSVGVSRVAVGVAVVARVRVDPRIDLVEHVRLMWADCLVILHLLRLRLNSRVYHIGGVARMRSQGVRCRAGGAILLPGAVRTRRRAVQGRVGVRGGVGVWLTAAEVAVA